MKFKMKEAEASQESMIGFGIGVGMIVAGVSIMAIIAAISSYKDKKNPNRIIDRILDRINQGDNFLRDYPHVGDKDDKGNPFWVPVVESNNGEWPKVETVTSATKEQNRCAKLLADISKMKDTETVVAYVNKTFTSGFKMETVVEIMAWPNGDWYNLKRTGKGDIFDPDTFRVEWVKWIKSLTPALYGLKKKINEVISAKPSDDKQDMASRLVYLKMMYQFVSYIDNVVSMYPRTDYELNMETPMVPFDDLLADDSNETK